MRRGADTSRQGLTGLTTADHTRQAACRRFGKGRDSINSVHNSKLPPNSFFILARCILGSCSGPRFVILECLTSGGHAVSMALAHGSWLLTTVVGNERVVWGRFDRSVNMTVSSLMRSGSDTVLTYTSEQCRFGFLFRVA